MPLTAEERAAINRQNASKSTGPKTDEGKARSRRNALKHGLRAQALALPNEDPAVVAARSDAWNDYYRPQSPAAQHLVNECVAATILSDRVRSYHEAALAKQIRDADDDWEVEREEAVETLAEGLKTDPARAARGLSRTGHGCRWLIAAWRRLLAALHDGGCWTGPECDEAIRLLGFHPGPETLRDCPEAWIIRLYDVMSHPVPSPDAIACYFDDRCLPDRYLDTYDPTSLPSRELSRRALRATAEAQIARALALEAAHRESRDDPDRAEAADRALVLRDGLSARVFLRYHAEARTAFHRAHRSLVKTLELDATADAETDAPTFSPIEPDAPAPSPEPAPAPAPAPPSGVVSPIEADPAPAAVGGPEGDTTSASTQGVAPDPNRPSPAPPAHTQTPQKTRDDRPGPAPQRLVG